MAAVSKESLVKYVNRNSGIAWVLSMAVGVVIGALGLVFLLSFFMAIVKGSGAASAAILLIAIPFTALGVVVIYSSLSASGNLKSFLKMMESNGTMPALLEDFSHSRSMANDKVRLGDKYIFGRKTGRPVGYEEIVRVYQHVHKQDSKENYRQLMAVLKDGKTRILCDLSLGNQGESDASGIMRIIRQQNPTVFLGYK